MTQPATTATAPSFTFTGYLTRGRFEREVEIEAAYEIDAAGRAHVTTWTGADDLTGEELAQLDDQAADMERGE